MNKNEIAVIVNFDGCSYKPSKEEMLNFLFGIHAAAVSRAFEGDLGCDMAEFRIFVEGEEK